MFNPDENSRDRRRMSQIEDTHPSRVSPEKLLLSQQSQRLVEDWALPGDRFMKNKANSNPNRANFCISSSVHRL